MSMQNTIKYIGDFKFYQNGWTNTHQPHLSEKISAEDARGLLSEGGWFVRNTYGWDLPFVTSFWYLIKDTYGGIEELPTKVRNQVRRSLNTYNIRKVAAEEMMENGYSLFVASRQRFGATQAVTKDQWKQRIMGGGQDFWLAVEETSGTPQGLAINRCYEDYCNYVSMGVNPNAPKSTYPMYGLILEMNRYYLQERGLKYVMDGTRSINQHSNIQQMLEEKFRFRKAFCHLQMFYKPWMAVGVNMLFPFRHYIPNNAIKAILRQEELARESNKLKIEN